MQGQAGTKDALTAGTATIQQPHQAQVGSSSSRSGEGGTKAVLILVVFSMHNAWNCWVFLNFTNFRPAQQLLNASAAQIGFVTTVGWLGILSTVPLVTLWQGDHRTLLFVAGVMNVAPPVLRYCAALKRNYELVAVSNFLQGGAFGVLGAWPAMLAALQWPEERRTLVTAIASLSNYVGGAAGVTFMPAMADTAPRLLEIFRVQSYIAGVLFVLMGTWLWIPRAAAADNTGSGPGNTGLTLRQELRLCLQGKAGQQVLSFGLLVGMSLLLQGMNQFILAGVGLSDLQAGEGNALYQLAAAVVGVGLGSKCKSEADLQRVLHALHIAMMVGVAGFASLSWAVHVYSTISEAPDSGFSSSFSSADGGQQQPPPPPPSQQPFAGAVEGMLLIMTLLGGSLMGMLPFCLQQACYTAAPASENVVSGLIYLVAMVVAASLTQVTAAVPPLASVALVTALIVTEFSMYAFCCKVPPSYVGGGGGGKQPLAGALMTSSDDARGDFHY